MSFETLGLSPELCTTIAALGYAKPTPVQQQAIPKVLARQDLIAIAQTGTGKTAAFALPVIQNLTPAKEPTPGVVRSLILTPTRELALQVFEDIEAYAKGLGLTAAVLHGGVSYAPQLEKLAAGVDIVVATPGRLRDHLQQKTVDLAGLEILVLDEADRMLDMGFSEDVGVIIAKTSQARQTLLFSATFSDEIRKLAQKYLVKPASVQATPLNVTAQNVQHSLHPVDADRKLDLLFEVVHKHLGEQILVFTRTKERTDEVSKDLISRGLICMATHGDRTQAHRTKALARFKEGKVQILVATDIAARGLDTTDLGLVINYELPSLAEDYVHRIGRTGRAGKSGKAVSLVAQNEFYRVAAIEELIKFKIPVCRLLGSSRRRLRSKGRVDISRKAPRVMAIKSVRRRVADQPMLGNATMFAAPVVKGRGPTHADPQAKARGTMHAATALVRVMSHGAVRRSAMAAVVNARSAAGRMRGMPRRKAAAQRRVAAVVRRMLAPAARVIGIRVDRATDVKARHATVQAHRVAVGRGKIAKVRLATVQAHLVAVDRGIIAVARHATVQVHLVAVVRGIIAAAHHATVQAHLVAADHAIIAKALLATVPAHLVAADHAKIAVARHATAQPHRVAVDRVMTATAHRAAADRVIIAAARHATAHRAAADRVTIALLPHVTAHRETADHVTAAKVRVVITALHVAAAARHAISHRAAADRVTIALLLHVTAHRATADHVTAAKVRVVTTALHVAAAARHAKAHRAAADHVTIALLPHVTAHRATADGVTAAAKVRVVTTALHAPAAKSPQPTVHAPSECNRSRRGREAATLRLVPLS